MDYGAYNREPQDEAESEYEPKKTKRGTPLLPLLGVLAAGGGLMWFMQPAKKSEAALESKPTPTATGQPKTREGETPFDKIKAVQNKSGFAEQVRGNARSAARAEVHTAAGLSESQVERVSVEQIRKTFKPKLTDDDYVTFSTYDIDGYKELLGKDWVLSVVKAAKSGADAKSESIRLAQADAEDVQPARSAAVRERPKVSKHSGGGHKKTVRRSEPHHTPKPKQSEPEPPKENMGGQYDREFSTND